MTLDRRVVGISQTPHPSGLYSHQAHGPGTGRRRRGHLSGDITASGKSLVFMAAALNILLRDRFARVVALYPAKALIQDQIEKWQPGARPVRHPLRLHRRQGADGTACRDPVLVARGAHDPGRDTRLADEAVANGPCAISFGRLRLLILDEAHVYDGVFGTNMAYFLRRLEAVAAPARLIASTATIGEPVPSSSS